MIVKVGKLKHTNFERGSKLTNNFSVKITFLLRNNDQKVNVTIYVSRIFQKL